MNIHIPPAALEAGAKLLCARDDWKYPWDDLEEYDMQFYRDNARAAFLAMIESWPGMVNGSTRWPHRREIILPLQQEKRDDQ